MFQPRVIDELKKWVGFRNHFNPADVPTLPTALSDTLSGQYYQTANSNIRLDWICALLPESYDLDQYLEEAECDGITILLNKLRLSDKMKGLQGDLVSNNVIHDKYLKDKPILNENRFVGVEFCLENDLGLMVCINRLGLYLSQAQTTALPIYLFSSNLEQPVETFNYTSANANSFEWLKQKIALYFNNCENTDGSVFYLGYYQEDLQGQAIQYDVLNWSNGYCDSCDKGQKSRQYSKLSKHVSMRPFYVPNGRYTKGVLFDHAQIIYDYTNNFGFNFNISIKCDLSQFWIDNAHTMIEGIKYSVALRILEDMRASDQCSAIEQNVQINIIRDLEGDKTCGLVPFDKKVEKIVKAINLDHSHISPVCLPCKKKGVSYGAV